MNTGRIIIVNPCGKTGEVVAEDLQKHGLETTVITGPSARKDESGFLRVLYKEADKGDVAAIIPIFFPEVLAAHKNEFPGIIIPVDDPEKIKLLDDKNSACALAAELDIPQPEFYKSPDEVKSYPVVFKRPLGQGGDSVYFPKTRRALENLMKTADAPIIQEYIEGENVCVDALRLDGDFRAAAYRVLEPQGKGVSTKRAPADEPELIAYCKRMLDHIDYRGVCGFDFRRRAATGETYFLEANPRFSGGLETTIGSGLDLPWLLINFYLYL